MTQNRLEQKDEFLCIPQNGHFNLCYRTD